MVRVKPLFIPYYVDLIDKGLGDLDIIVFGVIDMFCSNDEYTSPEYIAEILKCDISKIEKSMQKLRDTGVVYSIIDSKKKNIITDKKQIMEVVDIEYINNWKMAFKIMWDLFIQNGYNIECTKKEIELFIEWIKGKSRETFGLSQQGDFLWQRTYNEISECFEWHKQNMIKIKRSQSHKGRVNTWFRNIKNGFKGGAK